VNRKMVLAMRLIGVGRAGMSLFCTAMDLPQPLNPETYNVCNETIRKAGMEVGEESMKAAALKEKELTDPEGN